MVAETTTTFGALLRRHRVATGLTQSALAERAGLSVVGIQELERGTTHACRDTGARLASALELAEDTADGCTNVSSDGYSRPVLGPVPQPMLARLQSTLPRGDQWRYEPKLDGFRGLLWRRSATAVQLLSRNARDLAAWFPELVQAGQALSPGTLLDGEIVIADDLGRSDFGALQQRLSIANGPRPRPRSNIRPSWSFSTCYTSARVISEILHCPSGARCLSG